MLRQKTCKKMHKSIQSTLLWRDWCSFAMSSDLQILQAGFQWSGLCKNAKMCHDRRMSGVYQALWHQSLLCRCGDHSIRGTECRRGLAKWRVQTCTFAKNQGMFLRKMFLLSTTCCWKNNRPLVFRRSKDMTPWKMLSRHLRKHRQARILANRLWFARIVGTISAKFWSLHSGPRFGPPKKAYLCVGQWTTQKKMIVRFMSVHRLLLSVWIQGGVVEWQL